MEHETESGWTGSPAQVSDEDNGGNGVGTWYAAVGRSEVGLADAGAADATGTEASAADATVADAGGADASAAGATGTDASEIAHGTGNGRVDAALRLLERLPGLPVTQHPQLFEQVHTELSEVLGELDSGSAPGPAGR